MEIQIPIDLVLKSSPNNILIQRFLLRTAEDALRKTDSQGLLACVEVICAAQPRAARVRSPSWFWERMLSRSGLVVSSFRCPYLAFSFVTSCQGH